MANGDLNRARIIISFLKGQDVSNENITRLLNYHLDNVYRVRDLTDKTGKIIQQIFEMVTESGVAIPIERYNF